MRLIIFTLEGSFEELMKSQIMSVKPTEYAVMGKKPMELEVRTQIPILVQ